MSPVTLDGAPGHLLARRWGVPQVSIVRSVPSSMDAVHELGARGATHGATVIALEQTAGRGRDGRTWYSPPGGVWLSMLVRSPSPSPQVELATLSLRVGLVIADTLDELLGAPRARVKWPNDVLLDDRKVAGALCEGRWQGNELQWLAVGVGVNVTNEIPPELNGSAITLTQLAPTVRRTDVLDRLVPALGAIVRGAPSLIESECRAFAERDWLAGRALRGPARGHARGIRADGALLVERDGAVLAVRDGHIELA